MRTWATSGLWIRSAIEQGLAGFVDGDHFFDLHAQEKVFDLIITILNHQHHVVGRAKPIELYRSYGSHRSSTAATTSGRAALRS